MKKIIKSTVKYLHLIGVDNLLIKPLDPVFLGYAQEKNKDFIGKCVERTPIDSE